jgi:hypothetical protein
MLDFGASHHMTHSHELFPSTFGDSTQLNVLGSSTMQLDKGCMLHSRISSRRVYHSSQLYKFASFEPSSNSFFISHIDSLSRL